MNDRRWRDPVYVQDVFEKILDNLADTHFEYLVRVDEDLAKLVASLRAGAYDDAQRRAGLLRERIREGIDAVADLVYRERL